MRTTLTLIAIYLAANAAMAADNRASKAATVDIDAVYNRVGNEGITMLLLPKDIHDAVKKTKASIKSLLSELAAANDAATMERVTKEIGVQRAKQQLLTREAPYPEGATDRSSVVAEYVSTMYSNDYVLIIKDSHANQGSPIIVSHLEFTNITEDVIQKIKNDE